jgi:hypothetical protein
VGADARSLRLYPECRCPQSADCDFFAKRLFLTKWFSRPFLAILRLKTCTPGILPTPTGAWAGPTLAISRCGMSTGPSERVLTAYDVSGQGELFFVRKVRDPEVVDRLGNFCIRNRISNASPSSNRRGPEKKNERSPPQSFRLRQGTGRQPRQSLGLPTGSFHFA